MEPWEEALQKFQEQVNVADPVLDQAYASVRDVFTTLGFGDLSAAEARLVLTTLIMYANMDEGTRLVVGSYLGTLLDLTKEE